jgi:hypothetical protein
MARNNNIKVVPASQKALNILKYEIAAELGLPVGGTSLLGTETEFAGELGSFGGSSSQHQDYWGYLTARDTGAVGGHITRRLTRNAEETIFSLTE